MNKIIKNRIILIFLAIIIILIICSNSENIHINFSSDNLNMIYIYIGLFIIGFVYLLIKLIDVDLVFKENEIIVKNKIFGIKIKSKEYCYVSIEKFIIGKFINNRAQKYIIYIDQDNNIKKLKTYNTYKECLKIIEDIKEKAKKLIYDGTDENFNNEEDLFRNYYKIKNTIKEIKYE